MSISGPTLAGSAASNSASTLTIHPSATIPAGSLVFVTVVAAQSETTTVSVADSVSNGGASGYNQQVESADPNDLTATTWLFWIVTTVAVPATTGSITVTIGASGKCAAVGEYFTGLRTNFAGDVLVRLIASEVEWLSNAAGAAPLINSGPFLNQNLGSQLTAPAGSTCYAMLGVKGPNTDAFTQDTNWGSDVHTGSANYTIHSASRLMASQGVPNYAPTMGTARKSIGIVIAFD